MYTPHPIGDAHLPLYLSLSCSFRPKLVQILYVQSDENKPSTTYWSVEEFRMVWFPICWKSYHIRPWLKKKQRKLGHVLRGVWFVIGTPMFKLILISVLFFFIRIGVKKKHRLIYLLTLETLSLLLMRTVVLLGLEVYFVLLIIAVCACEGGVGLRTIISIARHNKVGNLSL